MAEQDEGSKLIVLTLANAETFTAQSLVDATGILMLAFSTWALIQACWNRSTLIADRTLVLLLFGITIGYWFVSNQSILHAQWSLLPVRVGLGSILLACMNLILADWNQTSDTSSRFRNIATTIFPCAGILFIVGGSHPIELLLGIELVCWGQYCASHKSSSVRGKTLASNLTSNYVGLMLILAGIVLGGSAGSSLVSPRTNSLGYFLLCVGIGWKFWLIPLKNVLGNSGTDFRTRFVFNQLLWGMPATLFLALKSVPDLSDEAARKVCVLFIVTSLGLLVFGAILSLSASGWKRLIAGLHTMFFGQLMWAWSLRLWEIASPERNLVSSNDWPGAEQVMQLIALTWVLGFAGICICLRGLFQDDNSSNDFDRLSGVFRDQPLTTFTLMLSLMSLGGLPFTPGFWSTLFLLVTSTASQLQSSLTELFRPHAGFLMLSLVGMLALAATATVILRVISVLWLGFQRQRFRSPVPLVYKIVIVIICVLNLALGTIPESFLLLGYQ